MATTGTRTLDGHGFQVEVFEYFDETFTRAVRHVAKTKKGATSRANRDRDWAIGTGEVVDLHVEQIDGFPGLWFVVWEYTPERAALTVAQEQARADARARILATRIGL
jgi:hypothetical protein